MDEKVDSYVDYTSPALSNGASSREQGTWVPGYFEEYILAHIPSEKDTRILDVGCGYGRYLKLLLDRGYTNASGIDISEKQIAYAKDVLGLANASVRDAFEFLEHAGNEYGVILLLDVLEHLETRKSIQLIRLIRQSLKDGGVLIIQAPNALAPLSPFRYGDITHIRAYTVHSMHQSLLMGGFAPENIRHFELPPHVRGLKSLARRLVWKCMLKPIISAFMLAAYGDLIGGIYTSNMLTVVRK